MSQRSSLVHSRIESTPDSGSCSVQLAITCLCLPLYASQCNEELEQDRMESSIVGCNTIQEMHLPCITTYTLVLKCNNSIVGCNTIQGMQLHVTTLVQWSQVQGFEV